MRLQLLYISLLLCLFFACFTKETISISATIEDCSALENYKIISEAEKSGVCTYLQVYSYKNELYTICECCDCSKFAYMAVNCKGENLCDLSEDCMVDFFKHSLYLYSVVQS